MAGTTNVRIRNELVDDLRRFAAEHRKGSMNALVNDIVAEFFHPSPGVTRRIGYTQAVEALAVNPERVWMVNHERGLTFCSVAEITPTMIRVIPARFDVDYRGQKVQSGTWSEDVDEALIPRSSLNWWWAVEPTQDDELENRRLAELIGYQEPLIRTACRRVFKMASVWLGSPVSDAQLLGAEAALEYRREKLKHEGLDVDSARRLRMLPVKDEPGTIRPGLGLGKVTRFERGLKPEDGRGYLVGFELCAGDLEEVVSMEVYVTAMRYGGGLELLPVDEDGHSAKPIAVQVDPLRFHDLRTYSDVVAPMRIEMDIEGLTYEQARKLEVYALIAPAE